MHTAVIIAIAIVLIVALVYLFVPLIISVEEYEANDVNNPDDKLKNTYIRRGSHSLTGLTSLNNFKSIKANSTGSTTSLVLTFNKEVTVKGFKMRTGVSAPGGIRFIAYNDFVDPTGTQLRLKPTGRTAGTERYNISNNSSYNKAFAKPITTKKLIVQLADNTVSHVIPHLELVI